MNKEEMTNLRHFLTFLLLVWATHYINFDGADAIRCYVCDTRDLNMTLKDKQLCSKGYGSEFEKKFIKQCKSGDNACKKWQILGKYWVRQCMKRGEIPDNGWMCDGAFDHYFCSCGVDKCNSGGNSRGTPLTQPSKFTSVVISVLVSIFIIDVILPILLNFLGFKLSRNSEDEGEDNCVSI